jgi:hypothetical protein
VIKPIEQKKECFLGEKKTQREELFEKQLQSHSFSKNFKCTCKVSTSHHNILTESLTSAHMSFSIRECPRKE